MVLIVLRRRKVDHLLAMVETDHLGAEEWHPPAARSLGFSGLRVVRRRVCPRLELEPVPSAEQGQPLDNVLDLRELERPAAVSPTAGLRVLERSEAPSSPEDVFPLALVVASR